VFGCFGGGAGFSSVSIETSIFATALA
jgi:hypothetical protein